MSRMDVYEQLPEGMRSYLSTYGWHFSKKLSEYAVSKMKNAENTHFTKEEVENLLKKYSVSVDPDYIYDAHYLFNMYYSDFYPKAIETESKLCEAVRCIFEDKDGYDGMALTRYCADCIGRGRPIMWEQFI